MIFKNDYPILEFDTSDTAVINPHDMAPGKFGTNKLIITFFPEVIERLKEENSIYTERTIAGENPVVIYAFTDEPDVLITLGYIGCPACAGNLDLFYGMGINKVMFCGGGGVLDSRLSVGNVLLVSGAIRDEGFSYHYIEPSRIISANETVNKKIASYLDSENIPYITGLTWTTDAIFRETPEKVSARKSEGAKIVEMEQAGCLAVAQFRGFDYGALIYAGDDVSGEFWDIREWRSRKSVRHELVMLCKKLVSLI